VGVLFRINKIFKKQDKKGEEKEKINGNSHGFVDFLSIKPRASRGLCTTHCLFFRKTRGVPS
jgi:hypothetical protein